LAVVKNFPLSGGFYVAHPLRQRNSLSCLWKRGYRYN